MLDALKIMQLALDVARARQDLANANAAHDAECIEVATADLKNTLFAAKRLFADFAAEAKEEYEALKSVK